jgi:hypothetical protein
LTTLNSFLFSPLSLQSVHNQSIFGFTMSNFSHLPEPVVPEYMTQPELNDDEDAVADEPNQLDAVDVAPNPLETAGSLVVSEAVAVTDREMEKKLDKVACKRHFRHWQRRGRIFMGPNVRVHVGGDNVDFTAAVKRPLFH